MAPKAATPQPPVQAGAGSTGGLVDQVSKLAEQEHSSAKQELVAIGGAMPDFMEEAAKADQGKGVSTDQADNLVPLIYVLQPLSPQVSRHKPEQYVPGAEPGDIWLKGAPEPIIKGGHEEGAGLLFQPVWFGKCVNEWIPRNPDGSGGGFVARHAAYPSDAQEVVTPGEKPGDKPRKKMVNQDRTHEYIETREHAGFAITAAGPIPYIIALSSTGHQVSREWMPLMNRKTVPTRDGQGGVLRAPAWAALYRLTTRLRTRGSQSWFMLQVADAGPKGTPLWVDKEAYLRGKALYEAFASGAKQAAAPDAGAADEEPDSHDGGEPATGEKDQIPF